MPKWFILVLIFPLFSCIKTTTLNREPEQIPQGIRGRVEVREGNFMPGPDRMNPAVIRSAQGKPARRELFIYELTRQSQIKATGVFYSDFQTKLIAKTESGGDGTFQVSLKPGKYSLFSKEPDGLFANRMDGDGYIFPVEVKPGQVSDVEFIIDYQASY